MKRGSLKVALLTLISIILLTLFSTLLLDFITRLDLAEYIEHPVKKIFNATLVLKPEEQRIINITLKNLGDFNASDFNVVINVNPPDYKKYFKAKISSCEREGRDVKIFLKVEVDKRCPSCNGTISIESLDSTKKYAYISTIVIPGKKSSPEYYAVSGLPERLSVPYRITLSNKLILYVNGALHTSYLRTAVFSEYAYSNNEWLSDSDKDKVPYTSSNITNDIPVLYPYYVIDKIAITYIKPSSIMPTSKYTRTLRVLEGSAERIDYYPSLIIFQVTGRIKKYCFETIHFRYDREFLNSLNAIKIEKYLQVPEEFQDLKELALKITKDCKTPYEKAKAIEEFLRRNYNYNVNFTIPKSENPIKYFLLKGKEGVCIHFNSAFVILARLAGLPARLVIGFLIDSGKTSQAVYSDQAHAWSEILFEKIGWIRFDATAGGRGFCHHCRGGKTCEICTKGSEEEWSGKSTEEGIKWFELIVNISNLSLRRGSTETISICAKCHGYNSRVKLTAIYDKRNFEVNLDPQIIDNNTKSHILILCKKDAIPGKYKIVIEGVDEKGRKNSVTITVTIEGYFIITFKELVEVVRGSKAIVNGSVKPKGLYPHSVTLRIEGLPNSIRYIIRPNSKIPPFNFNITFYASKYANVGDYSAKLIGIGSNGKKYSLEFTLRVLGRSEIIINLSEPTRVVKGQWVIVKGVLRSELEEPLLNKTIIVYLRESKERGELIKIGEGVTENEGVFTVNCTIPTNIDVGEYVVIAEFPGDDYYLGNVTDPRLVVVDHPVIYLVREVPLITFVNVKYSVIGKVCDSGGKPLANISVIIFVNQRLLLTNTNEKGLFEVNTTFNVGANIINITTPKLKYYVPSYRVLKTYTLLVDLSSRNWIRGERGEIHGSIKGLRYLNLNQVILSLENSTTKLFEISLEALNETFRYNYYVNKSTSVGHYVLSCKLPLKGVNYTIVKEDIVIMAKAMIIENIPVEVYRGDELCIVFKLVDYHFEDLVLRGVNVSIEMLDEKYNRILDKRLTSNETGFLNLKYKVPKRYNYTEIRVKIIVNDPFYLSTINEYVIKVKERSLSWIILISIVIALTASFSLLAYAVCKRKSKKAIEISIEKEEKEAEYEYVKVVGKERVVKKIKIMLSFPQIKKSFPLVWGVNDPLEIIATAYKDDEEVFSNFEFYIDGLKAGEGRAFTYVFKEKGTHKIQAILRINDSAYEKVRIIRIVEYREEIVRLYNKHFLKWVKGLGIEVLERTPEEIMYNVLNKVRENNELIERITLIFEEAKYSLHEIKRRHYEEFYMALYDLKVVRGGVK